MKRFYRLTPHYRLTNNPLFAHDVRRVRRGETAQSLTEYSQLLLVVVCTVMLLLWLVVILADRADTQFRATLEFSLLLFGLSLLATFALDYTCMTASIGSINGEISARRWDLLLLTSLESKQIVAAKYGAAQVRAWRLMVLIIAARCSVTLMAALTVGLALVNDTRANGPLDIPLFSLMIVLLVAAGCAAFYIIEPFWRMRTVTALGVAVSARVGQPVSSVVFGVGAVAAFWLAQGFVALALTVIVAVIIIPLSSVELILTQRVLCSPIFFLLAIAVTIYGFYSVVHTWGMRRALRFAARLDLSERKEL